MHNLEETLTFSRFFIILYTSSVLEHGTVERKDIQKLSLLPIFSAQEGSDIWTISLFPLHESSLYYYIFR